MTKQSDNLHCDKCLAYTHDLATHKCDPLMAGLVKHRKQTDEAERLEAMAQDEYVDADDESKGSESETFKTSTTWQERFNKEKKNWELYGPLGMGIAYSKLEKWVDDERSKVKEEERREILALIDDSHIEKTSQNVGIYDHEIDSYNQALDDLTEEIEQMGEVGNLHGVGFKIDPKLEPGEAKLVSSKSVIKIENIGEK